MVKDATPMADDDPLQKIGNKIASRNEAIRQETINTILQNDNAMMHLLAQAKITRYDRYKAWCGVISFLSFFVIFNMAYHTDFIADPAGRLGVFEFFVVSLLVFYSLSTKQSYLKGCEKGYADGETGYQTWTSEISIAFSKLSGEKRKKLVQKYVDGEFGASISIGNVRLKKYL